ncbi:hypothetical protein Aspvir_009423 [Aspergillus viridinutans]|uniref:Cytochrome P450 monooxygenase n=1 Tax=Aspergillus viridinutans TaxID=75553 RepID=A0A9P3C0F0_ASPVI|nr:uncharacterized protein Aspvir_009423 [Aspergillus viridinutans]GIK05317.1 hypothetical protein Aspvir_009423 [Aspergillus viridinutans]
MFLALSVVAALPLLALWLLNKLEYYRTKQFAAWPQPKPSRVWGHMKVLHDFISRGEPNRHIDLVFEEIKAHLGNPPLFFLDNRPMHQPMAVVCSHEIAEQVVRSSKQFPYGMPKTPDLQAYKYLLGPHSILSSEGEEWKSLRKRFNPGFAPQHLLTLLPRVLNKTGPFFETLDRYARSGEEFSLAEICTSLTFDIIGAVTMDEDLGAQLPLDQQSEMVKLYRELVVSYHQKSSVRVTVLNPLVIWHQYTLARRLDAIIKNHIKRKFADLREASTNKKKSRSVLALSLQDIEQLDALVLDQTCDQLKTFLFAGHDTTSILLQWAFYELSRTPRVLESIRRELDNVFGPDPSPAAVRDKLLAPNGGELLTKLQYTSAVIKEIHRLYPASGTARLVPEGAGAYIELPDGRSLCIDGVLMYNCETLIHRDETVYGESKDDFLPERWLGDAGASRIPPSAWRAFERGPRSCIGQGLATIESQVILACVVRRYEFVKIGLGEVAKDSAGEPILNSRGQYEVKSKLFKTMQVTGKPVDGMMMKVKLSSGGRKEL